MTSPDGPRNGYFWPFLLPGGAIGSGGGVELGTVEIVVGAVLWMFGADDAAVVGAEGADGVVGAEVGPGVPAFTWTIAGLDRVNERGTVHSGFQ